MKPSSSKSSTFALVLSMATILLALPSCKSVEPTINTSHSTLNSQHSTQADTLLIRDSIFIREMQKGDTVYLTRTEYRDRWRIQIQRDTIIDTQYVEKIIEKPPERYIPRFYKISTALLYIFIALFIAFIIIKIRFK